MKPIFKALIAVGVGLVIISVVLGFAGTWFVRRPWPQVNGTLTVSGLNAPVEIIRDEWGVPHIYAQNEYDLFFAQGYVHAQDRLWHMEFNRRIGNGTLSVALGDTTLDTDRFLRTIGLRRAAEEDWALTFVHQPLGQCGIGLLESLFNTKPIPARGDNFTVDAASFKFDQPFAMVHGASQRYIADMSDLDGSQTVHTTGQSGHLFHPHREDFIPLWQAVEYHPMPFSREAVEANAESTLTLVPQ